MDLNLIWFLLVGLLLAGYSVLDGFDFGVGILSLFRTKTPEERRLLMNAIGPVWDGNEVWFLTAGGALFAAFPPVYATVFSGFYLALMLLLLALIMRAVSFEFRSKLEGPTWRRAWDLAFGVGSLLPPLLLGIALGNVIRGIPLDADGHFRGSFLSLLNPYALVVGLGALALFTMHGAAYMVLKTDGALRERMRGCVNQGWIAFVVLYFAATLFTFFEARHLMEGVVARPLFWVAFLPLIASTAYIPMASWQGYARRAFVASSVAIIGLWGLLGVSVFPVMVRSSADIGHSLTIYNASSTNRSLTTMLVMALVGMPVVLGYTAWIYRVFKGKVVVGSDSY
ncbi:MAG: cytochrome d ubiquinol oxidase subunit II [Pseudomonadota bacterium]